MRCGICKLELELQKDVFYTDEIIKVTANIDNMECSLPVDTYSVNLLRYIEIDKRNFFRGQVIKTYE